MDTATESAKFPSRTCLLSFLTLLIVSSVFFAVTYVTALRDIRRDLLGEAYQMTQGMNLDRLASFKNTLGENARPDYQRVMQQYKTILPLYPAWDCCSLLKKNVRGQIFFFMDCCRPGSKTVVPFGSLYKSYPPELERAFSAGESGVSALYSDNWGSWVTAYIPLPDPQTGETAVVFSADLTAARYHAMLVSRLRLPTAFAVSLLLVLAVGFLTLHSRCRRPWIAATPMRYVEGAMVFCCGLVVTLTLCSVARSLQRTKDLLEFRQVAGRKAATFLDRMRSVRDGDMRHIQAFLALNVSVDFDSEKFLSRLDALSAVENLRCWGWAPIVSGTNRVAFEQRFQKLLPGFGILRVETNAVAGRAPAAPAYAPVAAVFPRNRPLVEGRLPLGVDLLTHPLFAEALREIRETGLVSSTPGCHSQQPGSDNGTYRYLLRAVCTPSPDGTGEPVLRGFIFIVLDHQVMMDYCLALDSDRSNMFAIQAYELNLREDGGFSMSELARWRRSGGAVPGRPDKAGLFGEWSVVQPCVGFGRVFALVIRPTADFFAAYPILPYWPILGIGLAISLALAALVHFFINRRVFLLEMVKSQTARLRKMLRRYEHLEQNSRSFYWRCDGGGVYQEVAPHVFDILGYHPDEMVGHSFFDFYPAVSGVAVRDAIRHQLAQGGSPIRFRYPYLCKNGETLWLACTLVALNDDSGATLGYECFSYDITEFFKVELEHNRDRKRYGELTEHLADIVWSYDLEENAFTYFNPAFRQALGYSEEEIRNKPVASFFAVPEQFKVFEGIAQAALLAKDEKSQPSEHGEWNIRRKNGTILCLETFVRSAQAPETGHHELFGISHDITAQKQLARFYEAGFKAMAILAEGIPIADKLDKFVKMMRVTVGADAVGVRMQSAGDYPYSAHDGYPCGFMEREDSLAEYDTNGLLIYDDHGQPSIRCACGQTLSASKGAGFAMTPEGARWTNCAYEDFKNLFPEAKLPTCIAFGFNSIALSPIRVRGKIVGLLQVNSYQRGLFSWQAIMQLEMIALAIGQAVSVQQAQEEGVSDSDFAGSINNHQETDK